MATTAETSSAATAVATARNTGASNPAARPSPHPAPPVSIDAQQHKFIEKNLHSLLGSLQKREPLDPSYDSLLPVQFRKHAKASATINKAGDKGGGGKSTGKKANAITADVKLHRRLNANLRSIVETYASTPAGWKRRPNTRRVDADFGSSNDSKANDNSPKKDELDAKLRAAFALRESKEHEQLDLVNATLKAENAVLRRGWGFSQVTGAGAANTVGGAAPGAAPMAGMLPPLEEASVRKKRLDGIAKQLREKEKGAADRAKWVKIAQKGKGLILNPESATKAIMAEYQPPGTPTAVTIDTKSTPKTGQSAKRKRVDPEQERQQQIEEAKKRERALRQRLEKEEEEHRLKLEKEREERERNERALETPRDALHRLYEPIFHALWDMEFPALGNTNPFRMVIDASTCRDMGVPDYCDIIKKPMNLTFIQEKVKNKSYEALGDFLEDVDLIVKNALLYNSHPDNPYHIAAKGFRKKFRKLAKPLVQSLTKGMTNN